MRLAGSQLQIHPLVFALLTLAHSLKYLGRCLLHLVDCPSSCFQPQITACLRMVQSQPLEVSLLRQRTQEKGGMMWNALHT